MNENKRIFLYNTKLAISDKQKKLMSTNSNLKELFEKLNKNYVVFINKKSSKIIKDYSFNLILDDKIKANFKDSKIMIIDYNENLNQICQDQLFILSFQKTLIIIDQLSFSSLQSLFLSKPHLLICFLSNSKEVFDQQFKIDYEFQEIDSKLLYEINNFNQYLTFPGSNKKTKIWNIIKSSISCYLIKQSYLQLNENRIENFFKSHNLNNIEIFAKEDFISLRKIHNGSSFAANLVYHIEKEEIFVLKRNL